MGKGAATNLAHSYRSRRAVPINGTNGTKGIDGHARKTLMQRPTTVRGLCPSYALRPTLVRRSGGEREYDRKLIFLSQKG